MGGEKESWRWQRSREVTRQERRRPYCRWPKKAFGSNEGPMGGPQKSRRQEVAAFHISNLHQRELSSRGLALIVLRVWVAPALLLCLPDPGGGRYFFPPFADSSVFRVTQQSGLD